MKKNSKAVLLLLGTSLCGLQAVKADEQNVFFGVNFGAQVYTHDDLSETYTPTIALMRLGVDVSRYLGFEARFGVGVTSDSEIESGKSREISNEAMMGAYVKGKLPVTSEASLYAMLGATAFDMTTVDKSKKTSNFKADHSTVSAGLGLQSQVFKNWLVNAEFQLYSFKSDSRLMGIELGGAYLF